MVQGTTSDAGKSVLVAGICRVLARKQMSVAPFKPQNMALNSAVTKDGGEIGRAQALQAQACYLEPHTDMNPILLKPSSDTGAQVIVQGKAITTMQAGDYHDYKKQAMNAVLESFQRLSDQYKHVIVEGAGSPAEINLRDGDIANMGFAEAADCPVILVADIDKGGVFAHLVGTLDLLSDSERNRVIGFVINKFRGDIALLEAGLEWLEKRTSKPVLGVLPYLSNLYFDAEDAISQQQKLDNAAVQIKVVVPVLSRISNHTDFDALRLHPQVDLQFVAVGEVPPACDLIILPGSKNVRADINVLMDNDWVTVIEKHLRYGGKLLGICGGFQMLGSRIEDPQGIEDISGGCDGFGLIEMQTTLMPEKQLKQVSGYLNLSNKQSCDSKNKVAVSGYEIHCGVSDGLALDKPFAYHADGEPEGVISKDEQIIGTYFHGLFDHPEACQRMLSWAGLVEAKKLDIATARETQLNRLADAIEEYIDLDRAISSLQNQALTGSCTNGH